jgi:hypothetical protein
MGDELRLKPLDARKGPQRIAAVRRVTHIREVETPYMLAKSPRVNRTAWLANLCWWVLHKIGGLTPHFEKIETYTYDEAVQERLTERVMFAADMIFYDGGNPEDYAVVLGEPELSELWVEMAMNGFITMRTRGYRHSGYRGTVMGLDVHAVPGLVGMALIPKVLIEKNVDVADPLQKALRRITTTPVTSDCQRIAREALGE